MGRRIDASTPSMQSVQALATTVKLGAKERQASTIRAHNIRHRKDQLPAPARRVGVELGLFFTSFGPRSGRAAFGSRSGRAAFG